MVEFTPPQPPGRIGLILKFYLNANIEITKILEFNYKFYLISHIELIVIEERYDVVLVQSRTHTHTIIPVRPENILATINKN